MATLTAWKFPTPGGAADAAAELFELGKQHVIDIYDAAIVEWPEKAKRPKTRQASNLVGAGTLTGAFWGMLFGILFFVPLLGALVGAAAGALSGSLTDVGINDDFIDDIRSKVTPGTSALFLLADTAAWDKVSGAFEGDDVELIHTNLSKEQEGRLRDAFGSDEDE